jgi:glutamate carboxypeptidase
MLYRQLMLLALLLALGFSVSASGESLTTNELRLAAWIDAHNDESIDMLEKAVNINSGTMNPEGVKAVADLLAVPLNEITFKTQWLPLPASMQRSGHLVARHSGTQGKKILLIGHLDTVFEPDDPFQVMERTGQWASGPGIADMKSGNIIIIQALRALAAIGALEGTQITVVFTGDEESPGKPLAQSRETLIEAARWADVALEFETGVRDEQGEWATISRRGFVDWCLEVSGKQAHSSRIFDPEYGAGAIFEAARILSEFYRSVRGDQYLTFNAGTISGGTEVDASCDSSTSKVFGKANVIPSQVLVRGELRTVSAEQTIRVQDAMKKVVATHLPLTEAKIAFGEGYPAMAGTEGNEALRDMLSQISQDLGGEPMLTLDPLRRGASDLSFAAPYADSLAGMGAYGENLHAPGERLDLSSIKTAVKRAAIMIYRLSRDPQ